MINCPLVNYFLLKYTLNLANNWLLLIGTISKVLPFWKNIYFYCLHDSCVGLGRRVSITTYQNRRKCPKKQQFQDDWEKVLGRGWRTGLVGSSETQIYFFLALSSYWILVSNIVGIDLARKNMVWLTDSLDYVDLNVKPRNDQNSSVKA